jgi:hypothetical protein
MTNVAFVPDPKVNGQFDVFAQAAGDIAAFAGVAVAEVTSACMGIAVDLGSSPAGTVGKSGTDLANFWCSEAVAQLTQALAGATTTFAFDPIGCVASMQAAVACQARCDTSAGCDAKTSPGKCTGGFVEIACAGTCTPVGGSIACIGTCAGQCDGTCTASGAPVDCVGVCEGVCAAKAGVGNGTGVQADGTCQGACAGSCGLAAPLACAGTCSGSCDAACAPVSGATSVICGGQCGGAYDAVACVGGRLEAGCSVDAKCQESCNASQMVRASCASPRLRISSSPATPQSALVAATLKKNLPPLLVIAKGQGQTLVDAMGPVLDGAASITASGKLDAKGTACVVAAGAAVSQGVGDYKAALSAAINVIGAIR